MPNVVVSPPEEEQVRSPPFLYFDASKARSLSTAPDLESLNIALDVHQQIENTAPVFQRANVSEETVVMPKRGGGMIFVPPNERPAARESDLDDEVVEVVKVRKHEGMSDIGADKAPTMTRSKTFKARATQAFRSIKSVGKSSRKHTLHKASNSLDRIDNVLVKPSPKETSSTRRGLSRRLPRPLSQIFQIGHDEYPQELGILSPSSASLQSPPLSPTRSVQSTSRPTSITSYYTVPASLSFEPEVANQFSSESSKRIKRASSFRKRLTLLELPRLFSSSSTVSSTTSSSNSQASIPSPPSPARDVPEPTIAFSEPSFEPNNQTASHNWMTSDTAYEMDEDDDDYGELQAPSLSMVREEDSHWNDLSLEMRLDSLHFDPLSFDPNEFSMASFKDGHRHTGRITVA